MKIVCPKCSRIVRLTDRECGCGQSLTLGSVIRFYWNSLSEKTKDAAVVQCAHCPAAVPLGSAWCPSCNRPVNVRTAFDSVVNPPRRRWRRFFASLAPMERLRWEARTQWAYMVFSLSLFWWMLSVVEERFPGDLTSPN